MFKHNALSWEKKQKQKPKKKKKVKDIEQKII